jgi:hypothetical protein
MALPDGNASVFSDSDRFEKLVNLDFYFDKVYAREHIEDKYYNILRMQRGKYMRNYKTNTGSSGADHYFMMNGDANGTLGFSPGHL